METLFVTKDAALSREDHTLIVTPKGQRRVRVPIEGLRQVVVAGEANLTTAVLGLCGKSGVRVTVLDWYGNVTGTFEPRGGPASGRVHVLQAAAFTDPAKRMTFARAFVTGAGRNILANLKYRKYRGNKDLADSISSIENVIGRIPEVDAVDRLMGFEGQMRAFYYDAWPVIHEGLRIGIRRRRPPDTPINCLISWFNGLCYSLVRNEIAKTHLDETIAFLHASTESRASLSLDISEIFKPAICDTIIFEMVLRGLIDESWFHQEDGVCRLSEKGRASTLETWIHKVEDRSSGSSFRQLVREEAMAVERALLGIAPYKSWVRKI